MEIYRIYVIYITCIYDCVYIYVEREIYFKKLAHMILGTGKSTICRAGWRPGYSGKS